MYCFAGDWYTVVCGMHGVCGGVTNLHNKHYRGITDACIPYISLGMDAFIHMCHFLRILYPMGLPIMG